MDYLDKQITAYLAGKDLAGSDILDMVGDARVLSSHAAGFWNPEEGHQVRRSRIIAHDTTLRFLMQHLLLLAKRAGSVSSDIEVVDSAPDGETFDFVVGNGLRNLLSADDADVAMTTAFQVLRSSGQFVVGVLESSGTGIAGESTRQQLAAAGFTIPLTVDPLPETDPAGNRRWLIVAEKP